MRTVITELEAVSAPSLVCVRSSVVLELISSDVAHARACVSVRARVCLSVCLCVSVSVHCTCVCVCFCACLLVCHPLLGSTNPIRRKPALKKLTCRYEV